MPPRTIINIPEIPLQFYTMPTYSKVHNILCCKVLTFCQENEKRFKIGNELYTILLYNPVNGQLESIIAANALTALRTTAGSLVALKNLYSSDKASYKDKVLAVIGAGLQGKTHITGFQNYFPFGTVNLWNRTLEKAKKAATELEDNHNLMVTVFEDIYDSIRNADVVVWAVEQSITDRLTRGDLKSDAFVISIGIPPTKKSEVGQDVYEGAQLFTESAPSAARELKNFIEQTGFEFREVGEIILKRRAVDHDIPVVYHSLGCGVMDAAAGRVLLDSLNGDE